MMSLRSDLVINGSLFAESAIPQATADFNDKQVKTTLSLPRWDEVCCIGAESAPKFANLLMQVGAEKFRQMRHNNETPVARPPLLKNGEDTLISSREFGRFIPVRTFRPKGNVKGLCLHMHCWISNRAYSDCQ